MRDIDYDVTGADGIVETMVTGRIPETSAAAVESVPAAAAEPVPEATPELAAVVAEEPAVTGDPDPVAEDPAVDPVPAAAAPAKKAKGIEPWMQKRLDEQTARQRQAEREAEEAKRANQVLQATIDALRKTPGAEAVPDAQAPEVPPRGYVRQEDVLAEAARIARDNEFNGRANQAFLAGKAAFPDFEEALQPLQAMGAIQRFDFQEAALATESAPEVLHYLGSNPEEASKILDSLKNGRGMQAVAAMTKIATRLVAEKAAAAKKAISKAPAPIAPVGGSAVPVFDAEKANMDQYSEFFDKKARAKGWY